MKTTRVNAINEEIHGLTRYLLALAAIFIGVVLVGVLLPAVNKVEDLGASGAGLEFGEWQA